VDEDWEHGWYGVLWSTRKFRLCGEWLSLRMTGTSFIGGSDSVKRRRRIVIWKSCLGKCGFKPNEPSPQAARYPERPELTMRRKRRGIRPGEIERERGSDVEYPYGKHSCWIVTLQQTERDANLTAKLGLQLGQG